jgi:hypothetical protein
LPEEEIPAFLHRAEQAVGEPIKDLDITRIASGLKMPSLIVHDRDDEEKSHSKTGSRWPGLGLGRRCSSRSAMAIDFA